MKEALRYVFGQRSIASLMILMLFAGMFATPPVAFMIPGLVRQGAGRARRQGSWPAPRNTCDDASNIRVSEDENERQGEHFGEGNVWSGLLLGRRGEVP